MKELRFIEQGEVGYDVMESKRGCTNMEEFVVRTVEYSEEVIIIMK